VWVIFLNGFAIHQEVYESNKRNIKTVKNISTNLKEKNLITKNFLYKDQFKGRRGFSFEFLYKIARVNGMVMPE
jgi:hypothetical protein